LFICQSADEAAHLLATVGDLCAKGSRLAFKLEGLGGDTMRAAPTCIAAVTATGPRPTRPPSSPPR